MRRGAPACTVIVVVAAAAAAACSGPTLSSTEQAAVVVTPSTVTFSGSVEIGSSAAIAKAIRFSPAAGNTPSFDQITAIVESCADFTVTGPLPGDIKRECAGQTTPQFPQDPQDPQLPAHGGGEDGAVNCQSPTITIAEYDVTFHPVTPGNKSCAVVFQGNFGQLSVTLTGVAVRPQFAMRVSPSTFNFGDVRRNTVSPPVTISITNTGRDPLPIEGILPPGSPFQLSVGIGGGSLNAHTIPVDGVETYLIRCAPADNLEHAGSMVVVPSPLPETVVDITCTGTDSQLVGPVDFVDLIARQHEPIEASIEIRNVGTAPASISDYLVDGDRELTLVTPGARSLAVGELTFAVVRYTADSEREHGSLGTLTVVHDTGKTTIPISGEARATEVGMDPAGHDFGPVCVGRSADRTVTVSANLAGHVDVLVPPVASGPLVIELPGGEAFPLRLEPNKVELSFTARFQPVTAEPTPMAVTIATDAPMMEVKEIAMTGEGMPPGVGASPQGLDFGALDPGDGIGPGRGLLLSNCTSQEVVVTGVRIEGPHANQFGIAFPADPLGAIAAFARKEYLIVLSPGTPGVKEATLVFEHTAGTTSVSLVGTTRFRRESYYDCSAGGGGAAAGPIGLVLAALLRRRRTRSRRDAAC